MKKSVPKATPKRWLGWFFHCISFDPLWILSVQGVPGGGRKFCLEKCLIMDSHGVTLMKTELHDMEFSITCWIWLEISILAHLFSDSFFINTKLRNGPKLQLLMN